MHTGILKVVDEAQMAGARCVEFVFAVLFCVFLKVAFLAVPFFQGVQNCLTRLV